MSWFGNDYQNTRSDDWYDTQQVCLNGHQITEYALSQPQSRRSYCEACGAKTIDACPTCKAIIRGYRHIEGVIHLTKGKPPKYCADCGSSFPWHQAALENLQEIIAESGLDQDDIAAIKSSIPNIIHETPKTDSAALKFKRIISKLSKPAYDLVVKVTTDLASEAAKKTFGF